MPQSAEAGMRGEVTRRRMPCGDWGSVVGVVPGGKKLVKKVEVEGEVVVSEREGPAER